MSTTQEEINAEFELFYEEMVCRDPRIATLDKSCFRVFFTHGGAFALQQIVKDTKKNEPD
jgi:hypothetical protein